MKIEDLLKLLEFQWGWEKGQPSNIRSEEHQKFLIEQYNRNRPIEKQVKNMAELNRALLTNEIKYLAMRSVTITERRVYHKVAKITIELPKDLALITFTVKNFLAPSPSITIC